MRPRSLLVILSILIGLGLLGAGLYLRAQRAIPAPTNAAPEAAPSATLTPSPTTSASSPPTAVTPPKSNPNPDLATDASGLSHATVVVSVSSGSTPLGQFRFKFYPKDAPNTVKRIIELINQGFYNGLTFHRVVPGFIIQGGDPVGNGTGGSGEKLKAEFNGRHHLEGTVAMARASDPDSADSQFYITLAPQPHLDHDYTIFGQVIEGMDVVRKVKAGDKMTAVTIE